MAYSEQGSVAVVTGARPTKWDAGETRVIERRHGLPGGRAVLGGLLISVAAVGVFVAYSGASQDPAGHLVVAAHDIRIGDEIEPGDLRLVSADLPRGTAAASFDSIAMLIGRVTLAPIGEGEIVQASAVTSHRATSAVHEVAVTLPRKQLAVGRLKQGERVDVFVTYDERTTSVVRGAQVVDIAGTDDRSLTSDREISIIIAVPSGDLVAALVHALRTGDVTVVRSTFADVGAEEPLVFETGGITPTGSSGSAGN